MTRKLYNKMVHNKGARHGSWRPPLDGYCCLFYFAVSFIGSDPHVFSIGARDNLGSPWASERSRKRQ